MTGAYRLTSDARRDLEQAAAWYGDQSLDVAERFLLAASDAFERIGNNPLHAAEIMAGTRRRPMHGWPYNVWYLTQLQGPLVFAVLHQRRSPDLARVRKLVT